MRSSCSLSCSGSDSILPIEHIFIFLFKIFYFDFLIWNSEEPFFLSSSLVQKRFFGTEFRKPISCFLISSPLSFLFFQFEIPFFSSSLSFLYSYFEKKKKIFFFLFFFSFFSKNKFILKKVLPEKFFSKLSN